MGALIKPLWHQPIYYLTHAFIILGEHTRTVTVSKFQFKVSGRAIIINAGMQ